MLNFGSEQEIEVPGGRTYRLSRWKIRHLREFRDWVAKRVGDPFASIERIIDKLPTEVAKDALRRAEEVRDQLQAFSLACPLGQRFLATEEGICHMTSLLLQEHHPQVAEDETWLVAYEVSRKLVEVLSAASGEVPNAAAPEAGKGAHPG